MLFNWFKKNRQRLTGSWYLGNEPNTIPVEEFENSRIKILIVRLSQYKDVCSGITHQYLYQMAASVAGSFVDMSFLPPESDERIMLADKIPLMFGTTSKRSASEFDIIAISNSVLQELINLPAMLKYSNIPLSIKQRNISNSPFVFIGGSNSSTHSILHGEINDSDPELSGLVDGVLMGDGEKSFSKMIKIIAENKGKLPRKRIIELLRNEVIGFYDPACFVQEYDGNTKSLTSIKANNNVLFPVKVNKAACEDDSETFVCGPVMYENSESTHVLLSSGCPSFCSFCKESWEQKPYREITREKVVDSALKLKANMGVSELDFMTFNANTCTDIVYYINKFKDIFVKVGIKSQRFDAIVKAPELLDLQFDAGKKTYTCAMEGISERIRILLQKNLNEETILSGIELLLSRGMRQMKTFLIVTGYETKKDIDEYREFLNKIKLLFTGKRATPKITFSFAVLFRSPQTPMQYAPIRGDELFLNSLVKQLCDITKSLGFDTRVSSGADDAIVSEYIACGDRRYTKILVESSIKHGFRYRGEINHKLTLIWRSYLKKYDLPEAYKDKRNENTVFPWDDIDTGVNKKFLWYVWNQINNGKEIRPCLSEPWGKATCSGCGACGSENYKSKLYKLGPILNDFQSLNVKDEINNKVSTLWIEFKIPEKWAFCSRDFIKTALARRIMLSNPGLVTSFINVDLISPDFFCFGKALAKANFKGNCITLNTDLNDLSDIQIKGRIRTPKNENDAVFPITLNYKPELDLLSISREIDNILSKYSIKNLKQRENGLLTWKISEGYASKQGIEVITLDEEKNIKLRLLKTPELHLLNKLSLGAAYAVS